ncbi:MAG: AAC(3) family N-acetyltransferase [Acholeplasma sp.]|nr:AAC(3) family N-acetyltransferase [Acholeplasma sp.]
MNQQSLTDQLKAMGLKKTDTVLMHASMKAIGAVSGGGHTVIKTLIDYFEEGLFMMPAHTWKTINETNNHFDPKTEKACVGILPNLFLAHPKSRRSLHPTHSVVCSGDYDQSLLNKEALWHTPTPLEGIYGKLKALDGYILLVGCGFERNTYIHSIEESMHINNRFSDQPFDVWIHHEDAIIKSYMYKHENITFPHLSENYYRVLPKLEHLGLIDYHMFGHALVMKMKAKDLFDHISRWLKNDPLLFDSNLPIENDLF